MGRSKTRTSFIDATHELVLRRMPFLTMREYYEALGLATTGIGYQQFATLLKHEECRESAEVVEEIQAAIRSYATEHRTPRWEELDSAPVYDLLVPDVPRQDQRRLHDKAARAGLTLTALVLTLVADADEPKKKKPPRAPEPDFVPLPPEVDADADEIVNTVLAPPLPPPPSLSPAKDDPLRVELRGFLAQAKLGMRVIAKQLPAMNAGAMWFEAAAFEAWLAGRGQAYAATEVRALLAALSTEQELEGRVLQRIPLPLTV